MVKSKRYLLAKCNTNLIGFFIREGICDGYRIELECELKCNVNVYLYYLIYLVLSRSKQFHDCFLKIKTLPTKLGSSMCVLP